MDSYNGSVRAHPSELCLIATLFMWTAGLFIQKILYMGMIDYHYVNVNPCKGSVRVTTP